MTYLLNNKISYDDSINISSFGRLRQSEMRLLCEYRYMYGSGTSFEMNDKLFGSATSSIDYVNTCFLGNVGTSFGDRVVHQTKQYHPYITGTSNTGLMAFVLNQPKINLVQSVGMFDDNNGIFLRINGLIAELVIRTNGVDSQIVPQSEWNVDRLNGAGGISNKSGLSIDFTKMQILQIDYQWASGRVRIGFSTSGGMAYAHYFTHFNSITNAYVAQPSLPLRWEILNSGTTGSNSQMKVLAGAVYSEGSDVETGFSRSMSTDGSIIPVTSANSLTDGKGVLAFRLKNSLVGKQNHAMARLKNWTVLTTEDIQYKIVILQDSSYVSGAASWSSVPGFGWCEYAKDFAMTSGWQSANNYSVIMDSFAMSGGGTGSNISSGSSPIIGIDNRSNTIFQNYDSSDSQIMAIVAYRLTADAAVKASMNWIEIK